MRAGKIFTVRELIAELQKVENQDGTVEIAIAFGTHSCRSTEFPYVRGTKRESGDYENYAVNMNPHDKGARIFVTVTDSWEGKVPHLTYRKPKDYGSIGKYIHRDKTGEDQHENI